MKTVLALLVAFGLSGCVPFVPVPVKTWAEAPQAPAAGDLVRVKTLEGSTHTFRVYKTDETAFYGVAKNDRKYRVPYATLSSMEVRTTELEWVHLRMTPYF